MKKKSILVILLVIFLSLLASGQYLYATMENQYKEFWDDSTVEHVQSGLAVEDGVIDIRGYSGEGINTTHFTFLYDSNLLEVYELEATLIENGYISEGYSQAASLNFNFDFSRVYTFGNSGNKVQINVYDVIDDGFLQECLSQSEEGFEREGSCRKQIKIDDKYLFGVDVVKYSRKPNLFWNQR